MDGKELELEDILLKHIGQRLAELQNEKCKSTISEAKNMARNSELKMILETILKYRQEDKNNE